ncbi:hypothetical protein AB0M95_05735 [Sphaerisporangium sp. NPDC051017]|uniref:hypothetical protein n=1 Tax=Sphaerisporangium sp. NPDC051017 TaxID=3154636 RepID=UPI0034388A6A
MTGELLSAATSAADAVPAVANADRPYDIWDVRKLSRRRLGHALGISGKGVSVAELMSSVTDLFKPLYGHFILADQDGLTDDSEQPWELGGDWLETTPNVMVIKTAASEDPLGLHTAGFRFETWNGSPPPPPPPAEAWDKYVSDQVLLTSGRIHITDIEGGTSPVTIDLGASDQVWHVRAHVRVRRLADDEIAEYELGIEDYEAEFFLLQFWPADDR